MLAGAVFRYATELRPIVTDTVPEAGKLVARRAEIAAWEDPPRGAAADSAPVLSIDGFAGPLDWLLEMAQARKIDLARLSIVSLIEAFATALEAALAPRIGGRAAELGRWAAWLVMAATLAYLRSRLLLPSDSPEARAAEDEAEALRHRLVSRAQARAVADWLERRPQLGRDVFGRGAADSRESDGRVGDITELLRACLVALHVPEQTDTYSLRPPRLWQVGDAIAHMRGLLGALPDGSPLTAFLPRVGSAEPGRALRCRVAMSSTLVAGLELARTGDLTLNQDAPWTPIRVQCDCNNVVLGGSGSPA
jgi:segregation and condensation protein A